MSQDEQYIPVGEIDRRIVAIEEQLKRLPLELDILQRLRAQAVELPSGEPVAIQEKLGPKQALLRFLATKHEPMKMSLVIKAVETNVASVAVDVKRTLYSTINSLKADGLVIVASGEVSITQEGTMESRRSLKK